MSWIPFSFKSATGLKLQKPSLSQTSCASTSWSGLDSSWSKKSFVVRPNTGSFQRTSCRSVSHWHSHGENCKEKNELLSWASVTFTCLNESLSDRQTDKSDAQEEQRVAVASACPKCVVCRYNNFPLLPLTCTYKYMHAWLAWLFL